MADKKFDKKRTQTQPARLWEERGIFGLIALSGAGAVAMIIWIVLSKPIGIPGEWTWPANVEPGGSYIPMVVVSALFIAVAGWLTRVNRWEKTGRKGRAVWLILLIIIAWMMSLGLLAMRTHPVLITGGIIASPLATTYFSTAIGIRDLPAALRDYPSLMQKQPQHARTHPPGPIVFFWAVDHMVQGWPGLARGLEAVFRRVDPDGMGFITTVLSDQLGIRLTKSNALAAVLSALILALAGSITLLPLYGLTASLYKPTTALRACLLFTVVPAFLLFAPSIDQFVLLFSVLTLWGFQLLRTRGNPLVGVFFALGLLMSLAVAVIGLFLAVWWLLERFVKPRDGEKADAKNVTIGLVAAIGLFLAIFVVLWLATGFSFPGAVKAGLGAHRQIILKEVGRTYWKWLLYNPIEFVCFIGLPLVIWTMAGIRGRFAWAWLITLLVLDVSGWVRAETGRIWLFLMPPAAMLAADRLGRLGKRFDIGFFSALALQLGQAIAMKVGLNIFIVK